MSDTMALLKDLTAHARRNSEDGWKFIDKNISSVIDDLQVLEWVYGLHTGLRDKNRHVRDLAASILEAGSGKLRNAEQLAKMMDNDPNQFVRFRLAFAHFKRDIRSPLVDRIMRRAVSNSDVGELARKYLGDTLLAA